MNSYQHQFSQQYQPTEITDAAVIAEKVVKTPYLAIKH